MKGDDFVATSARRVYRRDVNLDRRSPSSSRSPSGIAIASVSPASVTAGSPDLTIVIDGKNFQGPTGFEGLVGWSTQANDLHCCTTWLATNFVSSTQLTAVIPTSLLQNPGKAYIYVEIGDPMGISDGVSYPRSNVVKFDVLP
jgi:hypothetical protein